MLSTSTFVWATTFGTTISNIQSFSVISSPLGDMSGCGMSVGSHYYNKRRFYVQITGSHTIDTQSASFDTFIALYQPSFDPLNPTTNLIACNDDYSGTLSKITRHLTAGQQYEVVVTTYLGTTTGTTNFHLIPDVQFVTQTDTSKSFTAATNPLGLVSGCGITTGTHYYDGETFFVDASGSHTIETKSTTMPNSDTFIALYSPSFNPASPTTGLIACNDDSGGTLLSKISQTLTTGQQYELIVTTYTGAGTGGANPAKHGFG